MKERDELLQMYLDELEGIPELSTEEESDLLTAKLAGDKSADSKLIEGNLKYAMSILSKHMGEGLSVQDMISITNLELVDIVSGYEGGDLKTQIADRVHQALTQAIDEEKQTSTGNEEITAKVNVLMEVTERMAEELGRQATISELAHKMNITEDEVQALVKMSLNAMTRDDSTES